MPNLILYTGMMLIDYAGLILIDPVTAVVIVLLTNRDDPNK